MSSLWEQKEDARRELITDLKDKLVNDKQVELFNIFLSLSLENQDRVTILAKVLKEGIHNNSSPDECRTWVRFSNIKHSDIYTGKVKKDAFSRFINGQTQAGGSVQAIKDYYKLKFPQQPTQQPTLCAEDNRDFTQIKTIVKNLEGELVMTKSLMHGEKTQMSKEEFSEAVKDFNGNQFYQKVTTLMRPSKNSIVERPGTGYCVYCALVKVDAEIYVYIGDTTKSIKDRWVNHRAEIKKVVAGRNEDVKYKTMSTAGPDNILLFFIADDLSEECCAKYLLGDKYLENDKCLNEGKCNNVDDVSKTLKVCGDTIEKISARELELLLS